MLNLAIKYNKAVQEEDELPPEKLAIANVGRQDAKKHLEEHVSNLMSSNIIQTLGTMLDTVVFWRVFFFPSLLRFENPTTVIRIFFLMSYASNEMFWVVS